MEWNTSRSCEGSGKSKLIRYDISKIPIHSADFSDKFKMRRTREQPSHFTEPVVRILAFLNVSRENRYWLNCIDKGTHSLIRPQNLSEVSFIYTGAWASSPVQYQDTLRDFHGCQEKSSIPTRKRIMHGMRSKLREDGNYPKDRWKKIMRVCPNDSERIMAHQTSAWRMCTFRVPSVSESKEWEHQRLLNFLGAKKHQF